MLGLEEEDEEEEEGEEGQNPSASEFPACAWHKAFGPNGVLA